MVKHSKVIKVHIFDEEGHRSYDGVPFGSKAK